MRYGTRAAAEASRDSSEPEEGDSGAGVGNLSRACPKDRCGLLSGVPFEDYLAVWKVVNILRERQI